MKLVIQKCDEAAVRVGEEVVGSIGPGLLVLMGIHQKDTWAECEFCIRRILNGRYFEASSEKMWQRTVKDADLEILVVSQFTLLTKLKSGTRPDFHDAMNPEEAEPLFNKCIQWLKDQYKPDKIKTGRFGASMKVSLTNDGPTTILIEKSANLPSA